MCVCVCVYVCVRWKGGESELLGEEEFKYNYQEVHYVIIRGVPPHHLANKKSHLSSIIQLCNYVIMT